MSKRNAILEVATQLFSKNGYKETSMAELSLLTGAARGTIFHHFKNKEDIFLNILKNVQENILSSFQQHKETTAYNNGMEMVEGVTVYYLNLAGVMEDQFLLLHRHYPYQMAETNPICRSYLESVYNCLLDIFEEGISIGIKDGSVKVKSARNTAMVLFAMVDGVVRLNTYSLYHAGSLYNELMASCRSILSSEHGTTSVTLNDSKELN
ncbi:MAG: TetR/AcrR family transcriptional regulator [Desulfobacteraceae bacterium]|nr:TetR/AcrR family transcriptional regulator [Desulfobacteraceae bacterium]